MSASGATLRIAEVADKHDLRHARNLFHAYAEEFAAAIADTLCFQGFTEELSALPGKYAPPSGCLLLAWHGGRPAGCVAMRDLGDGTSEMKRLYVTPECRGLGVGRLLAEAVVRRAESAGYRRMVLDTIPEMSGAVSLYRSLGFSETGRYYDNPVERTIYLEKPLGGRDSLQMGAVRMDSRSLAEIVQADLSAYFEHLAARVERLVRSLSDEELWTKPFDFGNSVGRIVVHLTGNLDHYIGARVAGSGYVRDRTAEFSDPSRPGTEGLLRKFRETIEMVVRTLETQGERGLTTPVTDCGDPVRDRFGLFLVCAAHINNHIGQIVYLVQALGHSLDEKAW